MTDVAAINGFFLLTFAITFVVPVAQARSDRRELALYLHRAGPGALALIMHAHTDHDHGLHSLTTDLQFILNRIDAAHLNTPYLHRFHDHDRQDAFDIGLPALGEALLILDGGLKTGAPRGVRRALASVDSLTRTFERTCRSALPPAPPAPNLRPLETIGLSVSAPEDFHAFLHEHEAFRRRLRAMAHAGLWRWEQVTQATEGSDRRS
jgi:hypothetical protein